MRVGCWRVWSLMLEIFMAESLRAVFSSQFLVFSELPRMYAAVVNRLVNLASAKIKTRDPGFVYDLVRSRVEALLAIVFARNVDQPSGPDLPTCHFVQQVALATARFLPGIHIFQSVATVSERTRSSSQTAPQPGPSGGAMWPSSIRGALRRPHSSPSERRRRGSAWP